MYARPLCRCPAILVEPRRQVFVFWRMTRRLAAATLHSTSPRRTSCPQGGVLILMKYCDPRHAAIRRTRRSHVLCGTLGCCLLVLLAACGSPAGAQRSPTGTPQPTATALPSGPTLSTALLTYNGHRKAVIGVAWSPDGKRIASSDGQSVRVWDASTGQAQLTYRGHSSDVFQVAWSPDGSLIASASNDGTVQVWRPQA